MAWVGDGNNVARSFALACAMTGVEVALATPPGHGLDDATLDAVVALGGTRERRRRRPPTRWSGAEAVCTDVWVSMGQEAESLERREPSPPTRWARR